VRGFSLPGDFNTRRFLVMLNGHPLTDNIYNSNNFFEQDLGSTLELVERIEIHSRPHLGAVWLKRHARQHQRVVTRSPADARNLGASFETSSFGGAQTFSKHLPLPGARRHLLMEGSVFDDQGISIPVAGCPYSGVGEYSRQRRWRARVSQLRQPGLAGLELHNILQCARQEGAYRFGDQPSGDPGARWWIAGTWSKPVYKKGRRARAIQWRTGVRSVRYPRPLRLPCGGWPGSGRGINRGIGSIQLTYDVPLGHVGPLTIGASGSFELRNCHTNLDVGG